MHPKNRTELGKRVAKAAGAALGARGYVSAVDVLVGMGWLDPKLLEDWRRGRVDFLERVVHANLSRISKAMKLFRAWAAARELRPSETAYVRWTRGHRPPLRFSKSGNPNIERSYRTHWVSRKFAAAEKRKPRLHQPHPSPEPAASLFWEEADFLPFDIQSSTFSRIAHDHSEDNSVFDPLQGLVLDPPDEEDEIPF
jgi:hypothetical protein